MHFFHKGKGDMFLYIWARQGQIYWGKIYLSKMDSVKICLSKIHLGKTGSNIFGQNMVKYIWARYIWLKQGHLIALVQVTDARDGQSRTIRQFQFTDW